ncbi:MAG: bifunctional phosphoglucose/phosphomannose isomerase [Candidatus Omnitrophica bacterium]|nr:bifunctional phosphoglucose/phosphomannose isomerase [Candidatus Omnitrophota bacterium]
MTSLDNTDAIRRCDPSGMARVIASFPRQCRDACCIVNGSDIPASYRRRYHNIVCAGLGGSAIGADIARSYLADEVKIPIFVNRNYTLPAFVGRNTLVIVSSYSGNTEETLSALRDARSRHARIIAITSGGKLKEIAMSNSIPVVTIPPGLQPRAAIGYSLFTLLDVLSTTGVIGDRTKEAHEAIGLLEKMKDTMIGISVCSRKNIAKKLARHMYRKIPVIYASQEHMDAVCTRWRGQLAENAKTISSTHLFPEMTHNEIVGWEEPEKALKNLIAIILRDCGDHPRVSRRMDIVRKIIKSRGVEVIEVNSRGRGLLARILSLVYIGDYVSLYLAVLNGCDPTPVESIAYLKREVSRR